MMIGEVVGNVWATRKDERLNGLKLLIVKPKSFNDQMNQPLLVAADSVGAGIGENVLVVKGSSARVSLDNKTVPIDATIVGIVDSVELK